MGFFHENPVASGQISRLSDLRVQYQNAQQLRDEFARFHGFSESGSDGKHHGVAYYWDRGEVQVTNDTNADLITLVQCADPLLFDSDKAIWGLHVGLSWVESLYTRGLSGEMYWSGTPPGASYMSWGQPPAARESGMSLAYGVSGFKAGTTLASVTGADIALILDIDDPGSAVSGLDWHVRARISPYWSSTYSPGKITWDLALVRYG